MSESQITLWIAVNEHKPSNVVHFQQQMQCCVNRYQSMSNSHNIITGKQHQRHQNRSPPQTSFWVKACHPRRLLQRNIHLFLDWSWSIRPVIIEERFMSPKQIVIRCAKADISTKTRRENKLTSPQLLFHWFATSCETWHPVRRCPN